MKHSQLIGIAAAIGLIIFCFFPWSFIESKNLTVSGMNTASTSYGKPALLHLIFSVIMIALFSIKKIWAKRTNIVISALNLAWAIRNFILISTCFMGECPERKIGIYLVAFFSLLIFVMSLLPPLELKNQ